MEQDTLEIVYRKYYNDVYLYAFSLCKDRYLSEEAVSDTFYRALLSLQDDGKTVKFWLFRVCRNCLIDRWRRDRRKDRRPLEELRETEIASPGGGEDPLERILKEERQRILFQAILSLPEVYREAVILFYFEGFSGAETAELIGHSPGSLRTILYRARKELKKKISEYERRI